LGHLYSVPPINPPHIGDTCAPTGGAVANGNPIQIFLGSLSENGDK